MKQTTLKQNLDITIIMKEVMSGIWETEQDAITQPVMRSPN